MFNFNDVYKGKLVYNYSLIQWAKEMQKEASLVVKRREQLLFDVASFVLRRSKENARRNFGRGIGKTARTAGRSGNLRESISISRVSGSEIIVKAGREGVPYAAVHELGTQGKGGPIPTITPKNSKWLTIPIQAGYVGRRAREFDLGFFKSKKIGEDNWLVCSTENIRCHSSAKFNNP